MIEFFTVFSLALGLPPGLLSSLCYVESKHNPAAIHHDDGGSNSIGICQIKLSTAKDLGFDGTEKDLLNPSDNILIAGLYLKHQINRYNSIQRGVIAYNKGNAKNLTSSRYQTKVFRQWRRDVQTRR